MSSYGGFDMLIEEHSMEELLEFIRSLGFEVKRTNNLWQWGAEKEDVGYRIVGTDIVITDPMPSVRFNRRELVKVALPYKGTEYIKHDHDADKKLMSKLKRRFAIKPKK